LIHPLEDILILPIHSGNENPVGYKYCLTQLDKTVLKRSDPTIGTSKIVKRADSTTNPFAANVGYAVCIGTCVQACGENNVSEKKWYAQHP